MLSRNGAEIWYRAAGPQHAPALLFLHGGPGYSSYSFEHSIGPLLESQLHMIYFDQRDCGRSRVQPGAPVGMEEIVEDIEAVRRELNRPSLSLLGHSFGGLVALEYLRRYPKRVEKIVFLDVTADLRAIIEFQLGYILSLAPRIFPEQAARIQALIEGGASPLDKLAAVYRSVDWIRLQKELFWYREESLYRNMYLDIRADVLEKHESRLIPALKSSGYLESRHADLMRALPVPGLLIAGRHSHCVGEANLRAAASAWQIPLVWFEESGHSPFMEEPELFASTLAEFLLTGDATLTGSLDPRNTFDHEEGSPIR